MNIQKIARWLVLAPLFVIPFLALFVDSSLYFPFIAGKNFGFRILVEIASMAYVVLALADKRYRPQFSWTLAFFALMVVWMAIADAFAVNPHKAFWSNYERMDGWVTLIHVFMLFVVSGAVLTVDKLWRRWWMTFISVTAIVCGYGLLQLFGVLATHQGATRVDASLGNAEYLAGYLLLALAVTIWQAFESQTKSLRYSLFALAVAEIVIIFATGTRGAFVGLVAATVFGGLLWLFQTGKQGRKGAAAFLALILIVIGGFYALRNAAFIQNNSNLARLTQITASDLGTRTTIWGMALSGAKEKPITGWGQEGFNYVFNKYYKPSLYAQEPWFDRAHDVYLDWLVAGGFPALLFFLLLGVSAAVAVYRTKLLENWERVLILSAFVAYAIQGLVVFDNLFTYVPLALLLAFAHSLKSRPIGALERMPEAKGALLDTITVPAAAIIALFLIYMVNIPAYAAGSDLISALTGQNSTEARLASFKSAVGHDPFASQEVREQLLQFAQSAANSNEVAPATKVDAVLYAQSEIKRELERAPNDARLHVLYATFLRNIGQYEAASMESARAHELSPNKQAIILEQGADAWQGKDPAAARKFFEEAYALSPNFDDTAVYAAVGHIITNDVPGGKAILLERFGTTTIQNGTVLAYAYQQIHDWNDLISFLAGEYALDKNPTTGYQLGTAYAEAGRLNEARAQARAVMAAHPESASDGAKLLMQLGVK